MDNLRITDDLTEEEIARLIRARRQQVWIHSIIYYEMNDNIVSDYTWSKWACELEELQNKYPEIAAKEMYADVFKDFDHSTGHNLPLGDPKMYSHAWRLLRIHQKNQVKSKEA